MSGPQTNAWQTARPRHAQSTSRTPQSRSGTGSPQPSPTTSASQTSKQDNVQQVSNNVWAQKSSQGTDRSITSTVDSVNVSSNGFNGAEVKTALGSDVPQKTYTVTDGSSDSRAGGGAWSSRSGIMASGQPFFVLLAKQVASLENGG